MKKKIKLTPILLALILSFGASLTSCEDSETGTDSASVTVSQTEKETNADTDAKTDFITSEIPTENVSTETPAEDTEAPATTVPETEASEIKPTVTTTSSQKNTEYTNALTCVYAENDTAFYEFVFEKGVLVTVYVENNNGKDAFGKDTYQGLENSPFKGMIVEEIVDKFEKDGYTVTINE